MSQPHINQSNPDSDPLYERWTASLTDLFAHIANWADELGWSHRLVDKPMNDAEIGSYHVHALLLQQNTVRILVEPIARSAPGAEGVVDLYLMPGFDDIATLYLIDGTWQINYQFGESSNSPDGKTTSKPLSKDALIEIMDAMTNNAV